ncbi:MAG: M13 family metallopeptidase [Microscillaceae bacterium]|nr:M13 family metallopeptidase [Microscillaceae bacterium]MDW8461530.1 M13 family metallopeptidase [Cytophagales bacterium]
MRQPTIWLQLLCYLCSGLLFVPTFAQKKGLDLSNFDKSVRPQDDFYMFVNGGWMKKTEIPASESRWGVFNEIEERNRKILLEILNDALKKAEKAPAGSPIQLVGDLYASAMDSLTIEQLGKKPIEPELARLDNLKSKDEIVMTWATHAKMGISTPLGLGISPDAKNSRKYAVYLGVSGIGLPNRSYYLEETPRFVKIREEYLQHIAKMLELIGINSESAKKNAERIYSIEKRLAEAARTPVENRNPQKRYNKKSIDDLKQMTFNINWDNFINALDFKELDSVIVAAPETVAMLDRALGDFSLQDWISYSKWKVVSSMAPYLSHAFVAENFRFNSGILAGIQVMQPRWRRMMRLVDNSLGDALGQMYVERAFKPEAKQRMAEMIENLKQAMADRIKSRPWMSEETKQKALAKLQAIVPKIGYPDKWKDYKVMGLEIKRNDFYGNLLRIREVSRKEMMDRWGKPVDRTLWGMTPPTVNAYYSPLNNEIVFPAGILQPPFFDPDLDDAINYGAIGAVIGHELSHGFDDQGSQYDAEGNLKNWWTKEDRTKFEALTGMLVEQFNNYTVLDTVKVNGKLTLGENIADLGGLAIAYAALEKAWAKKGKPKPIDGFTAEQRFFIGWATAWRTKARDEAILNLIKTDPHSPGYYRAIGPISNMEAFFKAFNVKEGDKMRRPKDKLIEIW